MVQASENYPPTRPVEAPPPPRSARRNARRLPLFYLLAFAAMIPWPLAAIGLVRSLFDSSDETLLMFGGITAIALALLGMVTLQLSEATVAGAIVIVWCVGLLAPPACFLRRLDSRRVVIVLIVAQSLFAFAQAALGALMIIGKSV